VSLKANAPAYAQENKPQARGVAQAKAKSVAESRARCELCRWMLQTISAQESTGCESLDRHLNVGAPTERTLPTPAFWFASSLANATHQHVAAKGNEVDRPAQDTSMPKARDRND